MVSVCEAVRHQKTNITVQKNTEEREVLGQHFAGPSEEVDSVGDEVVLEQNPQQLPHLRGLPHS